MTNEHLISLAQNLMVEWTGVEPTMNTRKVPVGTEPTQILVSVSVEPSINIDFEDGSLVTFAAEDTDTPATQSSVNMLRKLIGEVTGRTDDDFEDLADDLECDGFVSAAKSVMFDGSTGWIVA